MTARDKATLKGYFENGKTPNGGHYADLIDSYQDYGQIGTPASGAEIDTGTDNVKYATAKAIRDSGLISGAVSGEISGLTNKTTPVDADVILGENSASSFSKIKITWANIKATLNSVYAAYAKGVTNGDDHDHNGGDGASITEMGLHLNDVTTYNVGTTQHGFVPKAPNSIFQFLRGDGGWSTISGTVFPGSPSAGQRFFRTDLGLECYWDGVRWLTCEEYAIHGIQVVCSATGGGNFAIPRTDFTNLYISHITVDLFVLPTNDSTHYWGFALRTLPLAYNLAADFYTQSTQGLSPNTHYRDDSNYNAISTYRHWITWYATKTNSPGNLYFTANVFYRMVI